MNNLFKYFFSLLAFFSFFFSSVALAAVPTLETNPSVLSSLGITAGATSVNLAKRIQEFIFKLTTESLKRSLLNSLVSQMVTGISGGEPKFVTNWEGFLNQNYNLGREEAITSLENSGFFNSGNNFDSLLRSSITGRPSSFVPQEKTIEEKYQEQYSPFDWNSFYKNSLPENNYYGKSYIAKDIIDQKAAAKAEAAKNEAIAGGGFLSTKDNKGNISTPGKTIGDTLSRAISSDIDYIVNAEDIVSFVSAISSSVFNKLLGSGAAGIIGVANNILEGGSLGNVSFGGGKLSLGEFGQISLGDINNLGNIIFDSNSDSDFSSASNSAPRSLSGRLNAISSSTENLVSEEINNANSSEYSSFFSSGIDFNSLVLGGYKQNKILSYNEVKKALLYLEDLSSSLNSKYSVIDEESKGSNSNNEECSENLYYLLSVNDRVGKTKKITALKDKLQTILNGLSSEISASSDSESEAEVLKSSLEKEELSNLFLADLSSSGKNGNENFDLLSRLPLNLNLEGGLKIENKVSKKTISCYKISPPGKGSQTPTKTNYSITLSGPSSISNLNFFNNQIKYKFGKTTSGYGNYLDLNLSQTASSNFFYLHAGNLDNYLGSLETKINSISSLSLDNKSLSRKISYRQNKENVISEIKKAYLYLQDVDSQNSNLAFLDRNLSSKFSEVWKNNVSEEDLESSQTENNEFSNLFSASLGSQSGTNFDITNILPLNLNEEKNDGATAEVVSSGNIKTPVASFSANSNFMGLSVDLVFHRHDENKVNYLSIFNSKISGLKTKGYLK